MGLLAVLVWMWATGRRPRVEVRIPRRSATASRGRALAVVAVPSVALLIGTGVAAALWRKRSRVTTIPGSFACRARSQLGATNGLPHRFPHYTQRAEWRDGGLVLHGGNRFLTRTKVLGVVEPVRGAAPQVSAGDTKDFDEPVAFRLRVDTGDVIDLVCAEADAPRLLEPLVLTSLRAAR
jgi:hypothetical protein